jgi:phospho-N-acetylmuramoyl-pentapeptide-transferase
MIYYLAQWLSKLDVPGMGMFQYISFRSGMAVITSLIISLLIGKRIINYLQKKQIDDDIRNLGLEGQLQKKGTPTMGGVIILLSIVVPVILFANIKNIYVLVMLVTTLWLGAVGFIDDYIKVFKKHKEGLSGKLKILGQVSLGLFVGLTMYLSPDIVVREKVAVNPRTSNVEVLNDTLTSTPNKSNLTPNQKTTKTTIPFFKNNEFDYEFLVPFKGPWGQKWLGLFLLPW